MIELMGSMPFAPDPDREIVRLLKQVDARLDMRYLPIGSGCWAITEKWGENDPRRERIKKGEIQPQSDFDVLGFAPEDLKSEDALNFLISKLRHRVTEKGEYAAMMNQCLVLNRLQQQQNLNPVREFAHEMLDASHDLGNKIISHEAGFTMEEGKVVGTPVRPKHGLTSSEKDARVEMSDK